MHRLLAVAGRRDHRKYPARLRVTDWIHGERHPKARLRIPDWNHALPREQVTLAQALAPAGYTSAAIGKWHLGDGPSHYPTTYGFDVNVAGFGAGSPSSYFSPYDMPTLADGPPAEYLTDRLADEACRFVERHRDGPFFLYWAHYAVHDPLQAKPDQVERFRRKLRPGLRHDNPVYAAMIASLDDAVGKLCAKLDELGIADQTVVFFTSDNGGLINAARVRTTSNAPLRAGKGSVYEGGVRVPLIVRWPGVVAPGGVCDEPVIGTDYYPTVLEITASKGDDEHDRTLDGRSLVPLLRDPKAHLDREAIYWHYPHYHGGGATPYGAVRAGDFRLVEFYEDQHVELYDLRDDIGETRDLLGDMPERAATLRTMLHDWRARVGAQMPSANPAFKSP